MRTQVFGRSHGRALPLLVLLPIAISIGCSSDHDASADDAAPQGQRDAVDSRVLDDTPSVATVEIAGTVDLSEVGGAQLVAYSALDAERPVDANGGFRLETSEAGAQLVLIRDGEQTRALAISLPGPHGEPPTTVKVDAESTALGLLMLVPGLTAVEPARASARLDQFRHLAAFSNLAALLRDKLGSRSLEAIVEEAEVTHAFEAVVGAWTAAHADVKNTAAAPVPFNFSVEVVDDSRPARTKVSIKNTAPRYINVYRRLIDINDYRRVTPLAVGLNSFKGPSTPFASGLWEEMSDEVDLSSSRQILRLEYWFSGIGWGPYSTEPPSDIDPAFDDTFDQHWQEAALASIVDYAVGPLIWFVRGGLPQGFTRPQMELFYHVLKSGLNLGKLRVARTPKEIATAMQALYFRLLDLVIKLGKEAGLGASTDAWSEVGAVVKWWKTLVGGAKVWALVTYWRLLPQVSFWSQAIRIVPPGTDVTPPATVDDLRVIARTATGVTLSWTMPGDDGWEERARYYDIGYSTSPIDEANWDAVPKLNAVTEEETRPAGSSAMRKLEGLEADTEYYFAIRVADEQLNWSGLSNVVSSEDTSHILTTWKVSFFADGPHTRAPYCKETTPCVGLCPPAAAGSESFYLLDLRKSLNLPPIQVTETDGVIHGSLASVSGLFGTFQLQNTRVTVDGSRGEGNTIDLSVKMVGEVTYPLEPGLLPVPASLSGEFTVTRGTLRNDRITGDFVWSAVIGSQPDTVACVEFAYVEKNEGKSTICINDCRCGDGTCKGCVPAPGRCCCDD